MAIGRSLLSNKDLKLIYVLKDNNKIQSFSETFIKLFPTIKLLKFPSWDCLPYDLSSPDAKITGERINGILNLSKKSICPRLVVTNINSLIQKNVNAKYLPNKIFQLIVNSSIDDDFSINLINAGYRKSETVIDVGEYAIRGSIIDVFSSNYQYPIRIDMFGDIIESIKLFDPLTQITFKKINSITLLPVSEIILSSKTISNFKYLYREKFGINSVKDNLYKTVAENNRYPGLEHWISLFYKKLEPIFETIDSSYMFILGDGFKEICNQRMNEIKEAYNSRYLTYINSIKNKTSVDCYKPLEIHDLYLSWKTIDRSIKKYNHIFFSKISTSLKSVDLGGRVTSGILKNKSFVKVGLFKSLILFLKAHKNKKIKVLIACKSEGSRRRIAKLLDYESFHNYDFQNFWDEKFNIDTNKTSLLIFNLNEGFQTNDLVIITENDIFGKKLSSYSRKRKRNSIDLKEVENFHVGDHLIHSEYGLGKYLGFQTMTIHGFKIECLALSYLGGDKVYVPVQNINLLTKYGGDSSLVSLDKLGAKSWNNKKNKAKEKIRDLAETLIRIATDRQLKKATKLKVEKELYENFSLKFNYYETEDQLEAIKDIINDIKLDKPMDRLICGDVGFGKTEVAMRAAFIAVKSNTQVAVIAPTTVLVRQHLETFKERFKNENVKISQLSRLTKPNQKKIIVDQLSKGETDIIIGTHSLLSDNIRFNNLALFVIDEEQRFGVLQKEKIKSLTSSVHVLTLTATPIPRTLQMAISGIRDLSIIATPPQDRLPIRSFIIPYDEYIIREAINRELNRGGQVYCIVPRISDIETFENKIRKIVDNVNIDVVHGRMKPQTIENSMLNLYIGNTKILIATSILENGVDIQNANTIIVYKAEMFGLGQLYQFKGRVGRSNKRAYAYFLLEPNKPLTESSKRRLQILESLEGLGAGFSLASHDLDIRGAGNLLGDEQSGQIREIGVGLYQKLLNEAVLDITGEKKYIKDWSPIINIQASALIPENYVQDLSLRLKLYRRIGRVENDLEFESLAAEFIDRFGKIPQELEYLFSIMKIKRNCINASINKIDTSKNGVLIEFRSDGSIIPERLLKWIKNSTYLIKLRKDQKVFIDKDWVSVDDRLKTIEEISYSLGYITE